MKTLWQQVQHIQTKPPCPGSGKPLLHLGPKHWKCSECWKGWARGSKAPTHGQRYEVAL